MKDLQVVILSGLSGSGKSSALKILEDSGFFCIDNFPAELLVKFLELSAPHSVLPVRKLALVMDARGASFAQHSERYFDLLKSRKVPFRVIFFECRQDVLIRRFSETRHRHPLSPQGSVIEGIRKEQELLAPVRAAADKVIETTNLNVHELRALLLRTVDRSTGVEPLSTTLVSFGYKYGIPLHADVIMDVRFIPNPYFIPSLRGSSGRQPKVSRFVLKQKETSRFLSQFERLLELLIHSYAKEGKSYLTIGIGCTGGLHRSVVIAEKIYRDLKKKNYRVKLEHRDLRR